MQTYTDAIENVLSQSVILPPELLLDIENFVGSNRNLGYTTREEFIRDAVRWRLRFLKGEYEYVEVAKPEYERLQQAIEDLELPFLGVGDFIDRQIRGVLEKHVELTTQKEEYDKRKRRKNT